MTESATATPAADAPEYAHSAGSIQAHYSSMQLHRKCPQAWYYRYSLGLSRPDDGPKPELHFGSWWGALQSAESLERGRRFGSLKDVRGTFKAVDGVRFDKETVTVQEVLDRAAEWWAKQPAHVTEEWESRLGEGLPQRLEGAWKRWYAEWSSTLENEHPIGVEVFWKRDLPRPKNDREWDALAGEADLPTMTLIGYIDELYWDVKRGMVVARDYKSHKALGTQTAVDDMMDSQLQLYSWGILPKLREWDLPQVRAVAYDRIKSVKPSTPQLTLTGTLSKSVTQFDLMGYTEWASEDTRPGPEELRELEGRLTEEQWRHVIELPAGRVWGKVGEFFATGAKKGQPKFGVYEVDEKIRADLQTPSVKSLFLQRTLVPVSTNIVRAHLRAAVDTATDIWRTERRAGAVKEAARNLSGSNCRFCDYAKACRAQMVGGAEGTYELAELGLVARDGRPSLV